MQKTFYIGVAAAAMIFACSDATLAQSPANTDTGSPPASATPAPAAPAAPAPAASTPAATTPSANAPADTAAKPSKTKMAKSKTARDREIDRSVANGTVPSRYRSSVPKEYQQYIPFDKR